MALVLTRKPGEQILIKTDPPVLITYYKTIGLQARIGIDVDRSINIVRVEILDQEQERGNR